MTLNPVLNPGYALVRAGAVDGLSIGFRTASARVARKPEEPLRSEATGAAICFHVASAFVRAEVMNTENIGQKPNDALFHAEANVLLRAARESGGSLAGRSLEIHTDRPMCGSCSTVLPFVGLELGNPTVTFISPRGSSKTMRNGAWID